MTAVTLCLIQAAVSQAHGQTDPNQRARAELLAAGNGRSLWVVQPLGDDRFQLLHRTSDNDPNAIYKAQASTGRPVALAAGEALFIVYDNHTVQGIEWTADPQSGLRQYSTRQLPPLPAHAQLLAFDANMARPYALVKHTDSPVDPNDPNAAEHADPDRGVFGLYQHARGQWEPIDLPQPIAALDANNLTLDMAVGDGPGGRVTLLVADASGNATKPLTVYQRRNGAWTSEGYDRRPTSPWRAIDVGGHLVVIEKATGELVASVCRNGERLEACRIDLPRDPAATWAATTHARKLSIILQNEAGELSFARHDLNQPPGDVVSLRPLVLSEQSTSALNRHFAAVMLAMLVVVFLLTAWRRDPRGAMVNLPETLVPAETNRRFMAALVDLGLPVLAVGLFTGTRPDMLLVSLTNPSLEAAKLVAVGLFVLHTLLGETFTGTTLGKRMMGLRVVNNEGGNLNVWQALVRNIVKPIELMAWPLLFLILLSPGRQRMGDLAAKTAVVRKADAGKQKQDEDGG